MQISWVTAETFNSTTLNLKPWPFGHAIAFNLKPWPFGHAIAFNLGLSATRSRSTFNLKNSIQLD
ncbi:MAG: hypothetical protein F6K56_09210 [Moorea sp. SIO3G5]|nr:hypothetical protein [Moorena sp. SIO3G5]